MNWLNYENIIIGQEKKKHDNYGENKTFILKLNLIIVLNVYEQELYCHNL